MTICVTNKLLIDVINFKNTFKDNIYFDKGQNSYYKWFIQSRDNIDLFKTYLLKYTSRSNKKQRLFLTDEYYFLKDLKAYNASNNNPLYKAWHIFNSKWENKG